jgi:hypothetical protein
LEGVGPGSYLGGRRLAASEVARPDEHGEPVRRKVLGDLQAYATVASSDEGDTEIGWGAGFHGASSPAVGM